MIKVLCIFLLSSTPFILRAKTDENIKELVTRPVISRKCQALIDKRNQKIFIKQKINSLTKRLSTVEKTAKKNQKVAKNKLENTKIRLGNQLKFTKLQIKNLEEDIVRKGCPGISL